MTSPTAPTPPPSPDEAPADAWGELPAAPESWRTETAIDEFTPIYLALGQATKKHGSIGPAEVDALDLSVVAALLGVGALDGGDFQAASRDLMARRMAAAASGDEFSWE